MERNAYTHAEGMKKLMNEDKLPLSLTEKKKINI